MTRDFTLKVYLDLLNELKRAGYKTASFLEALTTDNDDKSNTAILRHDVDARPGNAVTMAEAESEAGFRSSYYFRAVHGSFSPDIMRNIEQLGHEIGYHYEDLASEKGNVERAWESFNRNLERFRSAVEVRTICMHGSPLSTINNRDLWKSHDYTEVGIVGEPYDFLDSGKFRYITDTGRCWNGAGVSIRDRAGKNTIQDYHGTFEIIQAISEGTFPNKIMINTHPQRWEDRSIPWVQELIFQSIKNSAKRVIIRRTIDVGKDRN